MKAGYAMSIFPPREKPGGNVRRKMGTVTPPTFQNREEKERGSGGGREGIDGPERTPPPTARDRRKNMHSGQSPEFPREGNRNLAARGHKSCRPPSDPGCSRGTAEGPPSQNHCPRRVGGPEFLGRPSDDECLAGLWGAQ